MRMRLGMRTGNVEEGEGGNASASGSENESEHAKEVVDEDGF
jgi:hypothetical protein